MSSKSFILAFSTLQSLNDFFYDFFYHTFSPCDAVKCVCSGGGDPRTVYCVKVGVSDDEDTEGLRAYFPDIDVSMLEQLWTPAPSGSSSDAAEGGSVNSSENVFDAISNIVASFGKMAIDNNLVDSSTNWAEDEEHDKWVITRLHRLEAREEGERFWEFEEEPLQPCGVGIAVVSYKDALLAPRCAEDEAAALAAVTEATPRTAAADKPKWEPVFVLTKVPYLKRDRLYGRQPDDPVDDQDDDGMWDLITHHLMMKGSTSVTKAKGSVMLKPKQAETKAIRIAAKNK